MNRIAVAAVLLLAGSGLAFAQTTPATRTKGSAAAPAAASSTAMPTTAAPLGAGQFSTEAAARATCPTDTIVWANTGGSKAYHVSGDKYYGHTKKGAYMCQKTADGSGYHNAGARAPKTTAATAAGTGAAKTK